MKKIIALALCLALICPTLAMGEEIGITFTDMAGREIALTAPAARIVALTASDCEILCAIGAGETLVGRGEYCNYPEDVLNVPSVQSGYETNIEEILALEPDAVIMSIMAQTVEQTAALEQAGIKVVISDAQNIEDVYVAINMLGTLTGKATEASTLADSMRDALAQIAAGSTGDGSKTVYFEVSPLEYGLWTAGGATFMNELAELMGLKNAFADVNGWAEISQEQVIERNPDYIVTITPYYGEGPTPVEEIASRLGWQEIRAVADGEILNADSDAISRPGPRLADAARTLFDFIYGAKSR